MADEQRFPARRGPADDGYRSRSAVAKRGVGRLHLGKRRTGAGNTPNPPLHVATGKPRRDTRQA